MSTRMSNLDKVSVIGTLKCTGRFFIPSGDFNSLYSEKAGCSVQEQKSVDKQVTITIVNRMFFKRLHVLILICSGFLGLLFRFRLLLLFRFGFFAVKTLNYLLPYRTRKLGKGFSSSLPSAKFFRFFFLFILIT